MNPVKRVVCKDCIAEFTAGISQPKPRPVAQTKSGQDAPGKRCQTHYFAFRRRTRAANHEKRVQKTYGLGPGEYELLYHKQGGKCAICERATGKTRRLTVDHDHATGIVRGLVCRPCNDLLGHSRDEPLFFIRAADYLKAPPAVFHIGIRKVPPLEGCE